MTGWKIQNWIPSLLFSVPSSPHLNISNKSQLWAEIITSINTIYTWLGEKKQRALAPRQDNSLDASSVMSAPSDVYAGLRLQKLPEQLCQQPQQSLALYGAEQRKWPRLLRGWPAALQPSMSTSTSCTYMAWPKNEITKVFSSELFTLLPSKEIM